MSEQTGEPDYGYDLVHEEVGIPRPRQATAPNAQREPDAEKIPDAEVGDLSYDLAHEVPPAERR